MTDMSMINNVWSDTRKIQHVVIDVKGSAFDLDADVVEIELVFNTQWSDGFHKVVRLGPNDLDKLREKY